jgi:cytochrome c biogenesis protein CcmG/thiol:disulfide interchange protein DsbE
MSKRNLNFLLILPPLVFLAFASVAYIGLRRENPDELPSALIGREASPSPRAVPAPARRGRPRGSR